jgi:hypothetical protein
MVYDLFVIPMTFCCLPNQKSLLTSLKEKTKVVINFEKICKTEENYFGLLDKSREVLKKAHDVVR